MNVRSFPPEVIEQLGGYVYLYVDPATNQIFYVGKGQGNRAFEHLNDTSESSKVQRIRDILARGQEPRMEILRHGLPIDEKDTTALHIEAAVIDALGIDNLTNEVRGLHCHDKGRMSVEDLLLLYRSEPANILEPTLLIRINQRFSRNMSEQELYDATRGIWKIGTTRSKARYAMAVYQGIIRAVYQIEQWFPSGTTPYTTRQVVPEPGRWEFVGAQAPDDIRETYLHKSVQHLFPLGSQSPFKYVNCGR